MSLRISKSMTQRTPPPPQGKGFVDTPPCTADSGYVIPDPKEDGPDPQHSGQNKPGAYHKKILPYVDRKSIGIWVDQALKDTRKAMAALKKFLQKKSGVDLANNHPQPSDDWNSANKLLQGLKAIEDALLPMELDPPIDTISHQVQFVIGFSGNISPSWTLLHFKGPTTGSTFATASKSLTHTLNIAIGPPNSPDTAAALNALVTGTAIGNAVGTTNITLPR